MRRRAGPWLPLLLTLAVALWNEASDLLIETWPDPAMQYGEAAKDMLVTMSLPLAMAIALRVFPGLQGWLGMTRRARPTRAPE